MCDWLTQSYGEKRGSSFGTRGVLDTLAIQAKPNRGAFPPKLPGQSSPSNNERSLTLSTFAGTNSTSGVQQSIPFFNSPCRLLPLPLALLPPDFLNSLPSTFASLLLLLN
jgi:hypothetical protein